MRSYIAEILQWPYGYWPSWYSLKLCNGLTGPRNVLQILIFLPAAVVAIKLLYGGSCAVIAKILQWLYMATWFLRKFSGTWPYRAIVLRIPNFFRLHLEVASELVSGIKMFLISMVALKILIPQKILQRPYGYTGHRGIR